MNIDTDKKDLTDPQKPPPARSDAVLVELIWAAVNVIKLHGGRNCLGAQYLNCAQSFLCRMFDGAKP